MNEMSFRVSVIALYYAVSFCELFVFGFAKQMPDVSQARKEAALLSKKKWIKNKCLLKFLAPFIDTKLVQNH